MTGIILAIWVLGAVTAWVGAAALTRYLVSTSHPQQECSTPSTAPGTLVIVMAATVEAVVAVRVVGFMPPTWVLLAQVIASLVLLYLYVAAREPEVRPTAA